ncbi:hypothetical protein HHK36_009329 [Tetracentron sinense]|uniref:Protein FAR1-RELATED SEQUENCE n=1 Tax=Tetracentron sinense TaxID=13715 RepID=A0A834ZBI5_TETSI|nr:hypothetical protein HHK36_009329 [Tetracentron sinense]
MLSRGRIRIMWETKSRREKKVVRTGGFLSNPCNSHFVSLPWPPASLQLSCLPPLLACFRCHRLVMEAGGHENLQFGERDVRNYVGVYKRLKLAEGDAEAMQIYFTRMQQRNSNFFYLMDLDNEGHLWNAFWADARSRAAYGYFSDVVTFDTTYLTNRYDMSFAPFVRVNHHVVLLGCGLLVDETIEPFIWMFKAWLIAMSGRPPNSIITDQCKAMQRAIAEESMIKQYSLEHNEWVTTLYEVRRQWVPVFLKDTFFVGMPTTQRSESMNSFFDGYVHAKTSLKEFVDQYDLALRDKYEKEAQTDFESFYTNPVLKTRCYFEAQIAEIYTREMFKKFQGKVCGMVCCSKLVVKVDGPIITFFVKERAIGKNGKMLGPKVYEVLFSTTEVEVRKDFKGRYVSNQYSKNVQAISPVQHYDVLYPQALQILDEGVISEVSYNIVLEGLQELLKKVQQTNDNYYDNGHACGDVETNVIFDAAQQDFTGCMKIRDPVKAKQIAPTRSSLDGQYNMNSIVDELPSFRNFIRKASF